MFCKAHYCLNIRLKKNKPVRFEIRLFYIGFDNQIIFVTFVGGARTKRSVGRSSSSSYNLFLLVNSHNNTKRMRVCVCFGEQPMRVYIQHFLWITYSNPDPIWPQIYFSHSQNCCGRENHCSLLCVCLCVFYWVFFLLLRQSNATLRIAKNAVNNILHRDYFSIRQNSPVKPKNNTIFQYSKTKHTHR